MSGHGVATIAFAGGVRRWAASHEIQDCDSRTKKTPPAIFTAPLDQVAAYLGAYLACDGTVTAQGAVELYSVNRGLLLDAQALFARLGVVTRLRLKRGRYKGAVHLSWRLRSSLKSLEAMKRVPIPGKKGVLVAALRRLDPRRPGNGDIVPVEYRKLLRHPLNWYKTHAGISFFTPSGANPGRQRGTEREIVRRAALAEGNAALVRTTDPTLTWDEVTSIEDLGVMETWGMSVDRHENYISAGLIVHNSSGFAVPLSAFLVGQNVQERLKFVSNGDDFAKQRVQGAKGIIESREYRDVFPNVRKGSKWADHEVFVRREGFSLDPTLHARGVETKGVGGRADHIIFDDICDQMNTESEARRKRVKAFARGTWLTRLEKPAGLALYIGTAWHPDDATSDLMQDPLWCTLVQRVSPDFTSYDQEVYGAGSDYLDGLPPAG